VFRAWCCYDRNVLRVLNIFESSSDRYLMNLSTYTDSVLIVSTRPSGFWSRWQAVTVPPKD